MLRYKTHAIRRYIQSLAGAGGGLWPGREKVDIDLFRYPFDGALAAVFEEPFRGRTERARTVRADSVRVITDAAIVRHQAEQAGSGRYRRGAGSRFIGRLPDRWTGCFVSCVVSRFGKR